MKSSNLALTCLGISLAASLSPVMAATISQTNLNANDSNPWNTAAVWGGNAVTSGNDYSTVAGATVISNSYATATGNWSVNAAIRDMAGNSPQSTTFGGDNLVLNPSTRLLMKGYNNVTSTAAIVLNGGHISHAPNAGGTGAAGTANLAGTITANAGTVSAIGMLPLGSSTNTLNITSTIVGSGTIQLVTSGGTGRTAFLNVTGNIDNFAGTFYLSTNTNTTLDGGAPSATSAFSFAAASAPAATLNLATASTRFLFDLDSELTFGTVIVGDTTLTPGTYEFADLETIAPGKFIDGAGSITVIPEPSTAMLSGLLMVGAAARRARKG